MLKIGDKTPELLGRDENGKELKMSDFAGKKLVLYFYPKDATPGCTSEACNLRDNYERLMAKGYTVVGVSVQDERSHQKFIEKHQLPFPCARGGFRRVAGEENVRSHLYGHRAHDFRHRRAGHDCRGLWSEANQGEGARRTNSKELSK